MKRTTVYLPLLLSVVLALGLYIGFRMASRNDHGRTMRLMPEAAGGKLDNIMMYIERDYVDTVNTGKLEEDAIKTMLEDLDPHSQYITADEFHEMNDPLMGSFEGIGVSFRIEKDTITVINPVVGGPSEKVGIMAGDRIVYIDDSLVAGVGIKNRDAMRKLKGNKGTQVRVKVHRRGVSSLSDFTITRDVIPTYSLDVAYMAGKKTGLIRLNKFSATTHEEFVAAAKKLKDAGMQKLILDLRGNSGGYLKAATDLADEFLTDGKLIVYTQGKNRPRSFAFATSKGMFETEDLAVLIDEGSASASEIVAGALQDNDRGTIIGRRSFGKGLVQEQMAMDDGSALRLTVARYYTPTGRSIQKPYDGDIEKYEHESFDRYLNGELLSADSVPRVDSLKFTTPGGKIVYGGGGITPDVYVPVSVDSSLVLYNRLANRGLIFQFAFDYADAHRPALNKYASVSDFNSDFVVDGTIFGELLAFAKEKGLDGEMKVTPESRKYISVLFKAYVARNVFDEAGFYPVFQQIDPMMGKALEVLQDQSIH
ncbi:MAG: S41 family peptidase [Bacteroidetes bacterium]|nr:S41 family peptidase [Bacteroidales bacterium]MBU1009238.1 S41 family peptidase [Bacteroidota bacterium]